MLRQIYVPSRRWAEPPPASPEDRARRILRDTEISLADAIEAIQRLYFCLPESSEYVQAVITELGTQLEEPLLQAIGRLKAMAGVSDS